jgi:hypothetical protein
MLEDRQATAMTYDTAKDVARVTFEHSREHARSGTFPAAARAQLLLDAQGFLVGVDLGEDRGQHIVVMLGPHEKVERTVPASIVVTRAAGANAYELVIEKAKALVRAAEKNPYLA